MWKAQPPWKKSLPSFPVTPTKSGGPVKHPLFENLVGGSTPPSLPSRKQKAERWGGCTVCESDEIDLYSSLINSTSG